MENARVGMRLLDSSPSIRGLPLGRSLVLTAMAVLLAVADWLPENGVIDPDVIEFWLTLGFAVSAIVLAVHDRGISINVVAWRDRATLMSITLLISTIGAEFVTRLIFRNVTTGSDNGGYFSRRWNSTGSVQENSAGFRGREFTRSKPAGDYRIAVVGDSFTYGNGVRAEDRYSDVLQSRLPSHFEVLNFGVPGANTPEHRRLVTQLLRDVRPDFILLQWFVNDVEDDDTAGRPVFRTLMPYHPLHNWLNSSSALYAIANMQWSEAQVSLGMTTSYVEYLQRRFGDPDSKDSVRDRELLRDLIAKTQQAHVPIGIVLFPDTAAPIDEHYPFAYLHERVLAVCRERAITCLDLRSEFAKIKDRQALWASRLDHHPSAKANAIAAVKILEAYAPQWAAPPK
jgi:lysophospholipase L1-like esterase